MSKYSNIYILPCCNFVNRQSVYDRNSQKESNVKFSVPFDSLSNCGGKRNHLVGIIYATHSFIIFNNSFGFNVANKRNERSFLRPTHERLALLKYRWEHLAENAWYYCTRGLTDISLKTRVAVNVLKYSVFNFNSVYFGD